MDLAVGRSIQTKKSPAEFLRPVRRQPALLVQDRVPALHVCLAELAARLADEPRTVGDRLRRWLRHPRPAWGALAVTAATAAVLAGKVGAPAGAKVSYEAIDNGTTTLRARSITITLGGK